MNLFELNKILRDNIKSVKPYSSARDEYKGQEGIFLDANENPYGSVTQEGYNRYPDPLQRELKEKIAALKRVKQQQVFLGNGSDEPIDLLVRMVCRPGTDNILILPPTYGMYEVSAGINDVKVKEAPLTPDFEIDKVRVFQNIDQNTKIIFICSPNNPTGNCVSQIAIKEILEKFDGLVVVDEAYIDFAVDKSMLPYLNEYKNLVVLQTFSKAWGMAALRLGMAFASEEIIKVFNKIKPPYNINAVTQRLVFDSIDNILKKEKMVMEILDQKEYVSAELGKLSKVVKKVYPSDANFLLVKTIDAKNIYKYLVDKKIITRDRSSVLLCEGCLRISVGKEEENKKLIEALNNYK
ncbi:MAG: histidinol-phosphate transaminase [Cytophagaceae bacterium]|nr:histidinol-phosphate transaminase [Cytophagaceae bacterium]